MDCVDCPSTTILPEISAPFPSTIDTCWRSSFPTSTMTLADSVFPSRLVLAVTRYLPGNTLLSLKLPSGSAMPPPNIIPKSASGGWRMLMTLAPDAGLPSLPTTLPLTVKLSISVNARFIPVISAAEAT